MRGVLQRAKGGRENITAIVGGDVNVTRKVRDLVVTELYDIFVENAVLFFFLPVVEFSRYGRSGEDPVG